VTERRYVAEPPTRQELEALAGVVEGGVRGLISARSRRLAQRGIDPETLSDEQILNLLVAEPILLRRPILTDGERAVVGANRAALARFVEETRPG
jgi:arsenate reductase-like glutaredoxin family protein